MNEIKPSNLNLTLPAKTGDTSGRAALSPQKQPVQAANPSENRVADQQAKAEEQQNTQNALSAQTIAQSKQSEEGSEKQRDKLEQAVTKLNDYIQSVQRDLQFNVDDDSGRMVVKVVDRKTNEVVRQIPDEVALNMARNLQQEEPLSLFTMKV
ncbi:MAG: flagellar protein FlaG [Pseudomonadales bacterium]|uniref:Flagellar protein FlaG n=1 Tax=Oleiphilus messinensis TaxID=141451 RepID=A0A1Y0ICG3_9GAMM|nr:flagellar protein FlaG [Oleiphilus messinensis]ARU57155.1 flagellar protein FlaG [Oleiphilus messinensis]MCG8613602.1 flagellar protein FlaG [Pseudomonadales bacterium]